MTIAARWFPFCQLYGWIQQEGEGRGTTAVGHDDGLSLP